MDICDYVNIFQGCGEIALPEPSGIAATWFFIKAQSGNTSPAATLPFGKMNVGPFSGGYPAGYGSHLINCSGKPRHLSEGDGLLGFTHLRHSGTGAVGYYYNYALVTPFYEEKKRYALKDETASPGYYAVTLDDIRCELTVSGKAALHRYCFGRPGGKISVDFSNDGLTPLHGKSFSEKSDVRILSDGTTAARVVMQGIPLYIAARLADTPAGITLWRGGGTLPGEYLEINERTQDAFGVTFELRDTKEALLTVAISTKSFDAALADLDGAQTGFETAKERARGIWNEALSKIEIDEDDEEKREIFYSNLYHSLVKPCDFTGESFVYDGDGPFVTDLVTLWDIYKTQLPLVFSLFPDISEKLCETLIKTTKTLGFMPNLLGLSSDFCHESQQARMLGAYALLSAYRTGINVKPREMLRAIHMDLFSEGKKDFTQNGRCESATWVLDMADCCAYCAELALELGETELYNDFLPLSKLWINAYDPDTGLLTANSKYYEGTLYNYSFRLSPNIEERIALFGGKKAFVSALDRFFGYGAEPVQQPGDGQPRGYIEENMALGRFEGFNNEPDMETPYAYIFADRHDRTCEVLRAGMKFMFTSGRGGIPGNNDSGGLSSLYVWNALGIFPVAGSAQMLIGSPTLSGAKIRLFNGNTFEIRVYGGNSENIYVKKATLNKKELSGYRFPLSDFTAGGLLELWMG